MAAFVFLKQKNKNKNEKIYSQTVYSQENASHSSFLLQFQASS